MEVGLFQHQSLRLTMSKELSQAISLLQYSALDIAAFLQEQALQNPLIDFYEMPLHFSNREKKKVNASEVTDYMSTVASRKETLSEHLLAQVRLLHLDEREQQIIQYVIETLDDHGYMSEELETIAADCACTTTEVEHMLLIVQQLDPIGVGARNLQECLLLQLKHNNCLTEQLEFILTEYFQEFAYKKWAKIAKECKIAIEEIRQLHEWVMQLNPRPGLLYASEEERFIVPDYIVKKEHNQLVAYANEELDLRLSVNEEYRQQLMNKQDKEVRPYLQEKYREFQWIMKGLHTRKHTLNAIVNALLLEQEQFFLNGPSFLKPLTMKELADKIEVHESTISRATTHKYIQTPFGTFAMKSFFTTSLRLGGAEETSTASVKKLIQLMIKEEDKKQPLSDQQIVNLLSKKHDIRISRRTVAKYRDQLKILSSSQRKSYA
ncbi:RNA polymerase factor sigma-54 [Priestia megaterium]|nr:RNA polymerase factor sigma-54 [Priestia megaterium]